MTPAEIRAHEAKTYAARLADADAFWARQRASERERSKDLVYVEPCHQACLEAEVIHLLATDDHRAEMLREHYCRRREYVEVVLPRNLRHRQKWRQQYGTDPAPPSERRHPEDDYAGRFSVFTDEGAQQIRSQEGLIRTGQVPLVCREQRQEDAA